MTQPVIEILFSGILEHLHSLLLRVIEDFYGGSFFRSGADFLESRLLQQLKQRASISLQYSAGGVSSFALAHEVYIL